MSRPVSSGVWTRDDGGSSSNGNKRGAGQMSGERQRSWEEGGHADHERGSDREGGCPQVGLRPRWFSNLTFLDILITKSSFYQETGGFFLVKKIKIKRPNTHKGTRNVLVTLIAPT